MDNDITIDTAQKFKSIFHRYYRPLTAFAYKLLESSEEGEDMVQDLFAKLWKEPRSFENEKAMRSFLFTSVKNQSLNRIKHNVVKNSFVSAVQEQSHTAVDVDAIEVKMEQSAILYATIAQLPQRKKEVLSYAMKGLKNQEIAERMNIALQTVKTLKSQAYIFLREELQGKL